MNIVLFGAPWCAPCKALKPLLTASCESAGLQLEYVDVEFPDDRSADITTVPTVRVYDEYGEVIREHRGGMRESEIRAFLGGLSEPKAVDTE